VLRAITYNQSSDHKYVPCLHDNVMVPEFRERYAKTLSTRQRVATMAASLGVIITTDRFESAIFNSTLKSVYRHERAAPIETTAFGKRWQQIWRVPKGTQTSPVAKMGAKTGYRYPYEWPRQLKHELEVAHCSEQTGLYPRFMMQITFETSIFSRTGHEYQTHLLSDLFL